MVAITIAAAIVLFRIDRLTATDDIDFLRSLHVISGSQSGLQSLFMWLEWRYLNWSGRVVPEILIWALTPASILVWRAISLILWVGTVLLAVRIVDLARPLTTWAARSGIAIAAFSVLFLMDTGVVYWGAFWVTGAMNYWWIIPFAVASTLPAIEVIFRRTTPGWTTIVLATLAAWVAAVSNEQIAAIVVVLGLAATVLRIVQTRSGTAGGGRRGTIAVLLPALGALIGAIVLFAAPGNAIRPIIDEESWLPGFSAAPLATKLLGGIQFTVHGMVNHTGLLLALVWLVLLVIILRSGTRTWITVASGIVAVVAITALVAAKFMGIGELTEFSASWMAVPEGLTGWVVLVAWILVLLATTAIPFALRRDVTGAIQSLLVAAAYASAFVISLSPSMYASGLRVFFVSNAALAVVLLTMLPAAFRGRTIAYVSGATAPAIAVAALSCFSVLTMVTGLE